MLLDGSYAERIMGHESKPSIKSSASCPTMLSRQPSSGYRGGRQKEPPPPMMTEAERLVWEKERVKKDNHNIIEKRRRYKINDCISELATLLPSSYDLDLQNKKGNILQASVDYIKRLKREQLKMSKLVARQEELESMNRQLAVDVQRLQSMVHTSGRELPAQLADSDGHQQFLHDFTSQQLIDSLTGQYDNLSNNFMTQPASAFDSSVTDTEMAATGADVGLSDFGFPSIDVNMAEDPMSMSDLFCTLSTDNISHLF